MATAEQQPILRYGTVDDQTGSPEPAPATPVEHPGHSYVVNARFSRAVVKNAHQTARVRATSFALAAKRALDEIMKRPGVKGLRHQAVEITVVRADEG